MPQHVNASERVQALPANDFSAHNSVGPELAVESPNASALAEVAKETQPEKNVLPKAQLSLPRSRTTSKPQRAAVAAERSADLAQASGEARTKAPTPVTTPAASSVAPESNDAALLRDVAILNRVEALLRQRQGREALALLRTEPVSLLRSQSKALTAAAHCQVGETARGRQALATMDEGGPAATTRVRALRYCGVAQQTSTTLPR
jgi:hypothetical protein